MRLFVAVDVPDEVKASIEADVVEPLRDLLEGARWTRPESRHLTLQFLGNVDDDRVDEISAALRAGVAGTTRFDAAFAEVGGFPNLRRPRVLWVGLGEGSVPMGELAGRVSAVLEPLGFEREDRPFTAHFTLARFQRPRIIEEFPAVRVPDEQFPVNEIVLFRSQLHPKGARYTALARLPLAAE